jgi:RNA polymerase primary sigma factor
VIAELDTCLLERTQGTADMVTSRPAAENHRNRNSGSSAVKDRSAAFVSTCEQSPIPDVVLQRTQAVLEQELDFVPNPEFNKRKTQKQVADQLVALSSIVDQIPDPEEKLPSHLNRICSTPLLTPEQETQAFHCMNYLKFRFNRLRSRLSRQSPDVKLLEEAESTLQQALALRDLIIRANLRLVVSVTRKFVTPQLAFDDLFSDGVVALMNAAEKFDFDRGYRFSTYAYYSISRSLYRFIKLQRRNRWQSDILEQTLESQESPDEYVWTQTHWDHLNHELEEMLGQLDQREEWIIRQRFAFAGEGKTPTYKVLAERLGICNERVRQLEKRALHKLRSLSEDGRFSEILDALNL